MEYLLHSRKGWTKKNHKYVSRKLKNGKWVYTYNTSGSISKSKTSAPLDSTGDGFEDYDDIWTTPLDILTVRAIDNTFGTKYEKKYRKWYNDHMTVDVQEVDRKVNKKLDDLGDKLSGWFNNHK